jgi:hypothetical protein
LSPALSQIRINKLQPLLHQRIVNLFDFEIN